MRVSLGPASAAVGLGPLVLEPPAVPVVPSPRLAGRGLLGGMVAPGVGSSRGDPTHADPTHADPTHADPTRADLARVAPASAAGDWLVGGDLSNDVVLLDGRPVRVALRHLDPERAVLLDESAPGARERVLLLRPVPAPDGGGLRREVVVAGWRFEVDVEPAARAALRERARRGREAAAHSGPTEVRAIIPGVVISISVTPGDQVVAGQQLLAVEAMKMQNELRAPRDGTIDRVAVGVGRTIDVGDLLLVIS